MPPSGRRSVPSGTRRSVEPATPAPARHLRFALIDAPPKEQTSRLSDRIRPELLRLNGDRHSPVLSAWFLGRCRDG